MISDSPYDSGELVLKPGHGVATGAGGALLMLALLQLLAPVSGLAPAGLLARIGALVAPAGTSEGALPVAGLLFHLLMAGLLGLLYAVSQRRIPTRGLIGVGLLFGLVVWVIGSVIIGRLFDESLWAALRSWPWLLANLSYGLLLAMAAVWRGSRAGQRKQPVILRD